MRVKAFSKYKLNFLDPVAAYLEPGPNEPGSASNHWKKMMDNPGERIFTWHKLSCVE